MCLEANRDNPLHGETRIRFDKDGYAKCWKAYAAGGIGWNKILTPPVMGGDEVKNGWIVSDRKSKKISEDNEDCIFNTVVTINRGIHVYTTRIEAESYWSQGYSIIPVRCHKSQLVAVSNECPQAVFMKVFLKKTDYDKALKA